MTSASKPAASHLLRLQSIAGALSWTTSSAALATLIGFGRSIVLARLLSPAVYGVFGLAMLVLAAVASLTNFGLTSSIIPRVLPDTDESSEVLNTIWTADIGRQFVVSLLLALAAYPSARYFGNREVLVVLLIIAFAPLIQGFSNIGMMLLRKTVRFRNIAVHRVLSELFGAMVVIIIAYYTRNVIALAIGQLTSAAIGVALSYWLHPYRPRLHFRWHQFRGSLSFSRGIILISILTYVTTEFDNLVVGKYLGVSVLGAYLLAYRLACLPATLMGDVVGSVTFPVFAGARASGDAHKADLILRYTVIACLGVLACILLPVRILSAELIHLVYGNKWDSAAPMLATLVFVGLLRGTALTLSPFLLGANRADMDAKAKSMEVLVFVPAVLLLVPRLGAAGAAYAGIASYLIAVGVRLIFISRVISRPREFAVPLLTFIALVIIGYALSRTVPVFQAHSLLAAIFLVLFIAASFVSVERQGNAVLLRALQVSRQNG